MKQKRRLNEPLKAHIPDRLLKQANELAKKETVSVDEILTIALAA